MFDIEKRREQQRKAAERRRRKNGVKKWKGTKDNCEICGNEYVRKGKNSKTCGEDCATELGRRAAKKRSRENCRKRKAPKIGDIMPCGHCGSEFERDNPRAKYCAECRVLQKKSALPDMRDNHRIYIRQYHKDRMKSDPVYAMKIVIRGSILDSIRRRGYTKRNRTYDILACSWEFFKEHIEKQFTKGMNWDNRGEWHIDHIIPIASAKTEQEVIDLNHYTNLRPMWAEDNKTKGHKRLYLI